VYAACVSLFCASCLYIAYVYVLYPVFLIAWSALKQKPRLEPPADDQLPTVHMLIPAYNEEAIIAEKIENSLALDYPKEKLQCTIISDQSTDGTDDVAGMYVDRGIEFIRNEEQKGKIRTLSELGTCSDADVLLITDANAIFDKTALRTLVASFRDSTVGLVNGNRTMRRGKSMTGDGEGAYWEYETRLKEAESNVFSNAFITGAMTAIRRELFIAVPGELEFDHVLPLHVVQQGYRAVFASASHFQEDTAQSAAPEWRVRVRNAIRGFTMVMRMGEFLNTRQHPWFTFHVYSRKVFRWLIGVPSILMLVATLGLLDSPVFAFILAAQVLFYAAAVTGYLLERRGVKLAPLALPFYFCLVNAASITGFWQAIRGQRMATWSTGR